VIDGITAISFFRDFQAAKPFPHAVMDGFIDIETVQNINREWPSGGWTEYHHLHSRKRANNNRELFGSSTQRTTQILLSDGFVQGLSRCAGIANLSADHSLSGAGLDESFAGGFLDIHADFNIHPELSLYRRINLLIYLNEDWHEEWGGHLELWGADKTPQVKIAPIAGRAVIFAASDRSFHGHPIPMTCPTERSRRSLAVYYYSPDPPPGSVTKKHSTLYLGDEAEWFQ
jgi:Rps23 Pro-64 3,4-dihydroxylase Tpa1-like proline 4-hydroxylase